MKKLISILLVMLFSACSSTMFIKKNDASLKELNEELEGEEVSIVLFNGDEITGANVVVRPDSTSIGNVKISTSVIKEITITHHVKGALTGMGVYGLSTLILAGIIYLSTQNEPYADVIFIVPPMAFVLGGLFGGISGDVERFIFPVDIVRVEISSIVKKTEEYIIVLWENKKIRLLRSEYNYILETDDGKFSIVVPNIVYLEKFD